MTPVVDSVITCVVIFFAPALAFRPRLLSSPWTLLCVPICSICLLAVSIMPAIELNLLGHEAARACLFSTALVGLGRAVLYLSSPDTDHSSWSGDSLYALLIALGFTIFFVGRLSLFGFDDNDEIYSWNKWAIDFYLGKDVTFQFTRWAYPLLFPRLLSLEYILNGSLEAQTAVKTALAIFPLCAMGAIALGSPSQITSRAGLTAFLIALIVFGAGAKSSFEHGMPDAMAATGVVISALILFERDRLKISAFGRYLLVAVLSSVAVLTKQPSLVWALSVLPILVVFPSLMDAPRSKASFILLIPALVAVTWWLTEGSGFHLNEGPVKRSMEERDLFQQGLNAARLLFTDYIEVSVVLGWMLFAVLRNGRALSLMVLFILPSLAFWLMFANYDLRAGLPMLLISGLLISLNDFGCRKPETNLQPIVSHKSQKFPAIICLALIGGATVQVALDVRKTVKRYSDYEYGDVAINNYLRIFGADAAIVREHIRDNENAVLWTPTNYVYGLLYGYRDVHFPRYKLGWNEGSLVAELKETQATHATTSGRLAYGPGGIILESILSDPCGDAFQKLSKYENSYNIMVYSINGKILNSAACDY